MWLLLTHTATVTADMSAPKHRDELNRRRAVEKCQMYVKVFFNNKEVFTTEPSRLNSDFRVNFGAIFRVVINQWPENLKVRSRCAGCARASFRCLVQLQANSALVGELRLVGL